MMDRSTAPAEERRGYHRRFASSGGRPRQSLREDGPERGVLTIATKDRASADRALWLIGGFKLAKGLLLLAVGLGALRLLHHDVASALASLIAQLHVDPDNRYVDRAFTALVSLDDRRLKEISAGTFFYSALLLTEGTGLLLGRRWAEYFTVIVTGSFIPLELYELARHVTFTRFVLIAINVAIVWYLIARLRRERPGGHEARPETSGAPPPRAAPP